MNDIKKLILQKENRKLEFYEKITINLEEYPEIKLEIDDDSTFTQVKFLKLNEIITIQRTAQETAQETTKEQVISILRSNPKITKQEIMKILNKADGTIKQHLSNLKKEDKIKRIGSTKSGYWKVI